MTPVIDSSDFLHLRALVRCIQDKPVLSVQLTYPGLLVVHMGDTVPYRSSKLEGHTKGSYRLVAHHCTWRIARVSDTKPFEELRVVGVHLVENQRITGKDDELVQEASFGVKVYLDDLTVIEMLPSPLCDLSGEHPEDIVDWQLFMPEHEMIKVGCGYKFSYVRSGVVPEEK